ncbi:MAG: SMC-Scp complex subunit ScpB [Thermoplasmatota archaeon]
MKATHVVEAALFSAGRAISVQEIMDETGLSKGSVEKAIKQLVKDYKERDTALEVGKAGTKWAMQVRTVVSDDAAKFAPMEIPKKVLKTLALIAYHQPIKQSELSDMIGSKVYDHIPELKERGLVKTRKDGQTKILSVTNAFPEYFGLDAANPEQIRRVMAKLVGIDPNQDKPKSLETFPEAASQPAQDDQAPAVTDAPELEAAS